MQLKLLVLLVIRRNLGQKLLSLVPGVKIKQTSRFLAGYRPRLSDLGAQFAPNQHIRSAQMQLKLLVLLVIRRNLGQKLLSLVPGVKIKQTSRFLVGYRPRLSVLVLSLPQISTFGALNVAKTPGSPSKSTISWLETCQPRARVKIKQTSMFPVGYRPRLSVLGLSLPQISTFGARNVAKTLGSPSKSTIPWLETCQPRARVENKTNFDVSSG